MEDKGQIIHMLHDSSMRQHLTDLLSEVTGPKKVTNEEVIKIISDILRFVLTLFVHDSFSDYRLFSAILEASSNIYF